MAEPTPKNVAGPFYVEANCCLTCGIPVEEAPDVFAWSEEDIYEGCFVYRQPQSVEAFDKVVQVMKKADLDCIRYRGSDLAELRKLREQDLQSQCDQLDPNR